MQSASPTGGADCPPTQLPAAVILPPIQKIRINYGVLASALFLLFTALSAEPLDSAYHDRSEINAFLSAIADSCPDWVRVDSIGHSSRLGLPIMMAKLSDNPNEDEPEPALLYVGQVHAEEVVGVETTLEIMRLLLQHRNEEPYRSRLEGLELYFIPTANPEGLDVVESGEDVTYRKNCRDNIGDGVFRYHQGAGWDTSGVDLNRNFGLHWERGDSLYRYFDAPYVYNYYRGPAPFSEPETQAMRDLALAKRFLFSANYHGSRTGRNAQLVIGPWSWDGRYPPDATALDALGNKLAAMIPTADGEDWYFHGRGTQRVGQSEDWFYQATGTFQYLIEVGDEIQPDSAIMMQVVNDNLPAAFYLMDLALGVDTLANCGLLGVVVTDATTGVPTQASIVLNGRTDPALEPLLSSPATGRFDRLLPTGGYAVQVGRYGYRPFTDSVSVGEGGVSRIQVDLEALHFGRCTFKITDASTGNPIPAHLRLIDPFTDKHDYDIGEEPTALEISPGGYQLELTAENYLPILDHFTVIGDTSVAFPLYPSVAAFSEDFDAFGNWQHGGYGDAWGIESVDGRSVLSDSPAKPYARNSGAWLLVDAQTAIDTAYGSILEIIHRPYFEPGRDFGVLEVYDNAKALFDTLAIFSQFPKGWDTTFINLDEAPRGDLKIRLRIVSDSRVEEDGWLIDNMIVYRTKEPYTVPDTAPINGGFRLAAFPNPTNASTIISVNLPSATAGSLTLYDLGGRRVALIQRGGFRTGSSQFVLPMSIASGRYYLEFASPNYTRRLPLTVIR